MPDFEILDVFDRDCHLVVKVQHLLDGSSWHIEHYLFQGREGVRHKRRTNAAGKLLMDDGQVAPEIDDPIREGEKLQVLSEGRDWATLSEPHLTEQSILEVIARNHQARVVSGWVGDDVLVSGLQESDEDAAGCPVLVAAFTSLIGRQV